MGGIGIGVILYRPPLLKHILGMGDLCEEATLVLQVGSQERSH